MSGQQISTAAELVALPVGSVVRSQAGTIACRWGDSDGVCFGIAASFNWRKLALPITVLYRPDEQPTAQPTAEALVQVLVDDAWLGHDEPLTEGDIASIATAIRSLLPGRAESVVKAEALREAAAICDRDAGDCPAGCNTVRCTEDNRITAAWLRSEADRIEAQ